MQAAPDHPQESQRLQALLRLEVLDSEDEQAFDELTELASQICNTPISLISLVDDHRQWFKSKVGIDAEETSKDIVFCSHAILQQGIFEVCNAKLDPRFEDNPLVIGSPDIRFYAGAPLMTPEGFPIGTLCVISPQPQQLTDDQRRALQILSNQVISQLEMRLHYRQMQRLQGDRERIFAMLAHDLRGPFNGVLGLSRLLYDEAADLGPEQLQTMTKHLLESSQRIYQTLDELLQWGQQRLGGTQVRLSRQDIIPALQETLALLAEMGKTKDIQLVQCYPSICHAWVDLTLFKSLVRNLVANGMKFGPQGGRVFVEVLEQPEQVVIMVSDEGPGIDDAIKDKLFCEIVEAQRGSRGEKGVGIGLSVCQNFVQLMQGSIKVDGAYSAGARFVVTLKKAPISASP